MGNITDPDTTFKEQRKNSEEMSPGHPFARLLVGTPIGYITMHNHLLKEPKGFIAIANTMLAIQDTF